MKMSGAILHLSVGIALLLVLALDVVPTWLHVPLVSVTGLWALSLAVMVLAGD